MFVLKGNRKIKKEFTSHHLRILSRHPSVDVLRKSVLIKGPKVIYRHGSTTDIPSIKREINSKKSIEISADKFKMKESFDRAGVRHAQWISLSRIDTPEFNDFLSSVEFEEGSKLIIKHIAGSRGTGNYLVTNREQLDNFVRYRNLSNYIIEKYKDYKREYRIHVTEQGCFYTCRKCLKKDTPKEKRFQRHDDNCVWMLEANEKFEKPDNWDEIVTDCVNALKEIGADVLAFDVKTTEPKKDGKVRWILIESCSAPSFGSVMAEKYKIELPKVIERKYGKN